MNFQIFKLKFKKIFTFSETEKFFEIKLILTLKYKLVKHYLEQRQQNRKIQKDLIQHLAWNQLKVVPSIHRLVPPNLVFLWLMPIFVACLIIFSISIHWNILVPLQLNSSIQQHWDYPKSHNGRHANVNSSKLAPYL